MVDQRSQQKCCPTAQTLRRWLDGREELSSEDTLHVRECGICQGTLEQLTDPAELISPVGATARAIAANGVKTALPYMDEGELARMQRNLATPPQTPQSQFATMEETPSQIDSGQAAPTRRTSRADTQWVEKHFDPSRYAFEGLVGRGGNADVFRVYDKLLDKQFAVKTIAGDSEKARLRMLREAKLMADIEHSNIARIFDVGQIDDESPSPTIYIMMEYLGGGTLAGLLGEEGEETDYLKLADLLHGVCDGLMAAHRRTIIHRDLKPANILLTHDHSTAKVADFGLANRVDDLATMLTRDGTIVGTPAFMSPEQASASERVGPPSDIYSLGATIYFMLTGRPPFSGNATAIARQIVDADPVSPMLLNPSAPRDLVAICERAMEKEPEKRYTSIGDLGADLKAFACGDEVSVKPVSALGRVRRQLRRNRKLNFAVRGIAILASLVVIISTASAFLYRSQSRRLSEAAARELANKEELRKTLSRSIEAADQLLVSVTEDLSLLPSSPGSDRIAEALLNRAKSYYEGFLLQNAGNGQLKYQLSRAHAGLARIAFRQGDTELGKRESRSALQMLAGMPTADNTEDEAYDDEEYDVLLLEANVLLELGSSVGRQFPSDPLADQCLVEAAELCEQILASDPPTEYADRLLSLHVSTLRNRSVLLGRIGQDQLSGQLAEQSGEAAILLSNVDGVTGKALKNAAMAVQNLGLFQIRHQEFAGGADAIDLAMEILSRVPKEERIALRTDVIQANLHTNRARIAMMRGQFADASKEQDLAIAIHQRFLDLEPDVPSHKSDLVDAILNATNIQYAQEMYDELITDSTRAISLLDELIGVNPDNPDYRQTKAMFQGNIAIVRLHQGKSLLAIQPLTESISELELAAAQLQNSPASLIAIAINHYSLSGAYYDLGQFEEALASLDESDRLTAQVLKDSPDFTDAIDHMTDSLFRRTDVLLEMEPVDSAAVLEATDRAIALSKTLIDASPGVVAYFERYLLLLTTRGDANVVLGNLDAAIEDANKVIHLAQQRSPESFDDDFRAPLMYAYLLKTRALSGVTDDGDQASEEEARRKQIEDARQQAIRYGAEPEDFAP